MRFQAYLARHAQTLIGSLGRIVQHPFATFMTLGVIGVALALPLGLYVIVQNTRTAAGQWNRAFDLSVYMTARPGAARAQATARQLRARGDVAAVRVVSAEEALAEFRAASGFGSALDALQDNPLPDTLIVTPTLAASTARGTDVLKAAIAALPEVQIVQLDTDWVRRLDTLLDIVRRVVILLGLLAALGVMLVVGNTIRLDILDRRAEIEVMKLVGATDGFARRPFLYSGIWYGLGGGLLAVMLVEIAVLILATPVQRLAAQYGSQYHLRGLDRGSTGVFLSAAVALAWFGSWLTATRHIRAMEPT